MQLTPHSFSLTYFLKRVTETTHYGSENLQLAEVGKKFYRKRLVTEYYLLLMNCSTLLEVTVQCVLSMTDA